jgi:uncharacterized membrane protein
VAAALLLAVQRAIWVAWAVLGGALFVAGIIEVVAVATRAGGNRQPELKPVSEAGVALARLVGVAVASLQSMMAVAIGVGKLEAMPLLVVAGLLMIVLATVLGVQRISAGLEAVRAAGHGALVKGYGPMLYRNKDDPRIWVPKLASVGVTLNFAHAVSWLILAALLVVPIGSAVVAIWSVVSRLR